MLAAEKSSLDSAAALLMLGCIQGVLWACYTLTTTFGEIGELNLPIHFRDAGADIAMADDRGFTALSLIRKISSRGKHVSGTDDLMIVPLPICLYCYIVTSY